MARTVLIIVIPLILLQVISTFIFYDNHWDTLSRRLAMGLAGDITAIRIFMRDYPDSESYEWIKENARLTMQLDVTLEHQAVLDRSVVVDANSAGIGVNVLPFVDVLKYTPFSDTLTRTLWEYIRHPFTLDVDSFERQVEIKVQLSDGVLRILAPRKRLFSSTTYVFVIWMVGSSLVLFGVATIFLRNQVRSVKRLARAADSFGKGREIPDFKPEGALEVRQAALAFNAMRNRIQRQIDQRTRMLAGVSHDLRTPLTRMKLQVEMMTSENAEGLQGIKQDIQEMERMLEGYLDFARGEGTEQIESVDLNALLNNLADRFSRNAVKISVESNALDQTIQLPPVAFERCLGNLIGNASRYAEHVRVNAAILDHFVEIHIDDDGPGIALQDRENVFNAFYRLDSSRNPETGGVGLGLAIAQDVVRGLGGNIILADSPLGGLRATVRIPL